MIYSNIMDVFAFNSFPLHNTSFVANQKQLNHLKNFLCENRFTNYCMYKIEVI